MKLKVFFNAHIKVFKVIAATVAFAMTAGLLWFANGLLGNPVSYTIVKSEAKKYVAENYADEGYVVKKVSYNFKNGHYSAAVEKPGSEDCKFGLSYSMNGNLVYDTYETAVAEGVNTRNRLYRSYSDLIQNVTDTPLFPYICSGDLLFEFEDSGYAEAFDFGLSKDILVPDSQYDISKLGAEGGLLQINAFDSEVTPEKAAEVLLNISKFMEQNDIGFYAVNILLSALDEDGDSKEESYFLENFKHSDIYENGLVERVKKNHEETEKFYAELNK